MTAEQFNTFWNSTYPNTTLLQYHFKYDFPDRWFRIHSLPKSKRYAENKEEWLILLNRQNEIITDLLKEDLELILVTGGHSAEEFIELHPIEEVRSIKELKFVPLDLIDLFKCFPKEFEPGQFFTPMFSMQCWSPGKFDSVLTDIAKDNLRAFFVSVEKELIIAPYDGGMDIILKNVKERDFYKQKYFNWLSERNDGM